MKDILTYAVTLGDAILIARQQMLDSGTGHSVCVRHERWCVVASEWLADKRERNITTGITPLLSFLPNGGLDAHRASFEPIAMALVNHTRY